MLPCDMGSASHACGYGYLDRSFAAKTTPAGSTAPSCQDLGPNDLVPRPTTRTLLTPSAARRQRLQLPLQAGRQREPHGSPVGLGQDVSRRSDGHQLRQRCGEQAPLAGRCCRLVAHDGGDRGCIVVQLSLVFTITCNVDSFSPALSPVFVCVCVAHVASSCCDFQKNGKDVDNLGVKGVDDVATVPPCSVFQSFTRSTRSLLALARDQNTRPTPRHTRHGPSSKRKRDISWPLPPHR